MKEPAIPTWLLICYFLAVVIGWGWLGDLDYQDARQSECATHGQQYDADLDLCTKLKGTE